MGNVELERTYYAGFALGKFEENTHPDPASDYICRYYDTVFDFLLSCLYFWSDLVEIETSNRKHASSLMILQESLRSVHK
jgi:hypothetical protein